MGYEDLDVSALLLVRLVRWHSCVVELLVSMRVLFCDSLLFACLSGAYQGILTSARSYRSLLREVWQKVMLIIFLVSFKNRYWITFRIIFFLMIFFAATVTREAYGIFVKPFLAYIFLRVDNFLNSKWISIC